MALAAKGQVQWGDLAAWAAALLTGVSLILALRLLFIQRRDLSDREEDRRKDQARRVAAWCVSQSTSTGLADLTVRYRNGSDEPIYDAAVFVKSTWGPGSSVKRVPLGLVPPKIESEVSLQLSVSLELNPPLYDPARNQPPVLIAFRDASGQWWLRDEHGVLAASKNRPEVLAT